MFAQVLDMVCDDRSKISVILCDWFGLAGKLRGCGLGSRDSSLVEFQTHDRKAAGSNPIRSGGQIFFPRVNFLC